MAGILKTVGNIYFVYQFLKKLVTPFEKTKAFELGIIDKKGKLLKRKRDLETQEEKDSYTLSDRLIWNLKRLLGKIPGGKSRIASYAAALWLIREGNNNKYHIDPEKIEQDFVRYLEDLENETLTESVFHEVSDSVMVGILQAYDESDGNKKKFDKLVKKYTGLSRSHLSKPDVKALIKQLEFHEDAPANAMGVGGDGSQGAIKFQDPILGKKKKKKKPVITRFAGNECFEVNPDVFEKSRWGKRKYARYENYVGNDEVGEAIREYGRKFPTRPLILKNNVTGAMLYLKYGRE